MTIKNIYVLHLKFILAVPSEGSDALLYKIMSDLGL